ncbi:MAG TPA: tRNA (adenosine(37)-N6)-threonylcarbamoyltransferase complex dimerization subunit type 1 TsaB [Oscillospiraceae bacterium]|nr:tRNA (adenosine(37)-N6)-threonylcarbamoyltransferase complex dimerization subunit type 1 TsaB [Oscillospiraceae bacterium]
MKILGVDSSAKTASVSIVEDGKVLSLLYYNTGFTHSQTLMPMIKSALDIASIKISEIDAYAVSIGPGSFTGIRIAIAAVKGMAQPLSKPCIAISTLKAAAYPLLEHDCTAVSVMDARREQVYEAIFDCSENKLLRLTDDSANSINDLYEKIKDIKKPLYFIGDGADICFSALNSKMPNIRLAPEQIKYQRADSVAFLALEKYKKGEFITAEELNPFYLRDSQAEQSLKKKK